MVRPNRFVTGKCVKYLFLLVIISIRATGVEVPMEVLKCEVAFSAIR